jgi:hypothetical protein
LFQFLKIESRSANLAGDLASHRFERPSYVKCAHFLYNSLFCLVSVQSGINFQQVQRQSMEETWTQRANNVLALMEKVPSGAEGSPEKNFHRAVWSLCQKLKDGEAKVDGGGLVAPPLT